MYNIKYYHILYLYLFNFKYICTHTGCLYNFINYKCQKFKERKLIYMSAISVK